MIFWLDGADHAVCFWPRHHIRVTKERVPVLRGLGETNALQMASHGPFLAWIWAPLHHHTSVIGSSCVNKVSYTTSSDCKETRDIKIAMFPSYTLLKNDDTGPKPCSGALGGFIHWKWHHSPPGSSTGLNKPGNLCACIIICFCQSALEQDEPRSKNKPESKNIYSPLMCKVSIHKTHLTY